MREQLFDFTAQCPYGMDFQAVYRQTPSPPLDGEMLDGLLRAGFRRNGNVIYTMACPHCRGCVPIRLPVALFKPDRNQRRVWKANQDIEVTRGPLRPDPEKLELCERFLATRYPDQSGELLTGQRNQRAVDYYAGFFLNSITETFEIAYRVEGKLLGLAVVDFAANALNAVYFYFDTNQARRSPGTLNILYMVELCRLLGLDYLYLGYWIEKVAAMSYKTRFKPHQLLIDGQWRNLPGDRSSS